MKTQKFILSVLFILAVGCVVLLAQTNAPPAITLPAPGSDDFWTALIAAATPCIVALLRKLMPNIPAWILPISTPLIGVALGAGANQAGSSQSMVQSAIAGALAVFIRESWDQGKKYLAAKKAGEPTPTASKPASLAEAVLAPAPEVPVVVVVTNGTNAAT